MTPYRQSTYSTDHVKNRPHPATAAELADRGDTGAVAAMMALLLGMRATEIVSRVVRDLDDNGRLLWIPTAKTEAGKRTLHDVEKVACDLSILTATRFTEDPASKIWCGNFWRLPYPGRVHRDEDIAGACVGNATVSNKPVRAIEHAEFQGWIRCDEFPPACHPTRAK